MTLKAVLDLRRPGRVRFQRALPILLAVSFYYVFLGSAGRFDDLPIAQTSYYDQLAKGFLAGHLHLVDPPDAGLVSQQNPFDHRFRPLWVWDASLYEGQYYLYFGPVPALLLAAIHAVSGYDGNISDQWPTVAFLLGRFWAGAALILGLANRAKVPPPTWLCTLSIAVFGLAHPIPYVAVRTHVYEAALAGGQCFVFLGLYLTLAASSSARFRRLLLLLAGTSLGLAVGCRVTMAIATPLIVLASLGLFWRFRRSLGAWIVDGLSLGVPFAGLCAAHGWYNWARFGSPLEFGIRFQTTTQVFHGSSAYVLPNLWAYLFTPPATSCRFPFLAMPAHREIPALFGGAPLGYATFEQLAGIAFLVPWLLLIPLCLVVLLRHRARRAQPREPGLFTSVEVWALICALCLLPTMIPVLHLFLAAPRYPGDAIGGLVLLGSLLTGASWRVLMASRTEKPWRSASARLAIPLIGAATCVLGALTAFAISTKTFQILNPIVYQRIEAALSFCPAPPEQRDRI